MKPHWLVLVFPIASCFAQGLQPFERDAALAAAKTITVPAVRAHMRFLSDSLLEGREPGTRGYDIAARYVATQIEAIGLQPAGDHGTYFQTVPLRKAINDGSKSSLVLVANGKELSLNAPADYVFWADLAHTESSVEAPIVFVGYGVTAPELNYDDYATVDVRGKVVAMLGNAPARFSSDERAYYADSFSKRRNAVVHGAIGFLLFWLPEDDYGSSQWQWEAPQKEAGEREWLDRNDMPFNSFPELRAVAEMSQGGAEKLFTDVLRTLQQALVTARASLPQAYPLAFRARISTVNSHHRLESENVAGMIQGSDPAFKGQYIVYSAHVDHIGICPPVGGSSDTVCHLTMDNASGVATILEIARAYTHLPRAPRRSILFLFVTGEEGNMEGSEYFTHYPTVPIKDIVADLNLDIAPAMRYPSADLNAIGSEHSSLARSVEVAAKLTGYKITPDAMPEENLFIRSDHYSFVQQGVPSVYFRNGADGGDVAKKWLQTKYHTPLDNMDQPIYYEAGVKAAGMVFLVGYEIAQQDQIPAWNKNDFFGAKFGARRPIPTRLTR